jgi:hypothetical protein
MPGLDYTWLGNVNRSWVWPSGRPDPRQGESSVSKRAILHRRVGTEFHFKSLLRVVGPPGPHLAIAGEQVCVGDALLAQIPPTAEQVGPDPPLRAVGVTDVPVITSDAVTAIGLMTLRAITKIEVHTRQSDDIVGHVNCPVNANNMPPLALSD